MSTLEAFDRFKSRGKNLMEVDTSKPVDWVPGAEGIIRARERQRWIADLQEGKTQAALQLAAQVCDAGGHVIFVDVENDEQEMAERLQPIAASYGDGMTESLRTRFAYRDEFTALSEDADNLAAIRHADLIVIDSMTRILSELDLDEDRNKDIAKLMREVVDPIAKYGQCACLLLDNTGHNTSRSRGARSKTATVESEYTVSGGKNVSEKKHGTLTLKLVRSRSGKLAEWVTAAAGGGDYGRLTPQEGTAPATTARTTARDSRRVAIGLEVRGNPGRVFSVEELTDRYGVSVNTIKADLASLKGVVKCDGGWLASVSTTRTSEMCAVD